MSVLIASAYNRWHWVLTT